MIASGHTLAEPGFEGLHLADAAAELNRDRDSRQDRVHRRGVARRAREGAVEVDHVEPGKTLLLEDRSLRGRIVTEDLGLCHVPLDEADAASLLEVDRRVQDHGCFSPSCRKELPSGPPV
jgi:hypothetical protein